MTSEATQNETVELTRERSIVSSILHNENKCVSINSIAMDLNLSRFDAWRLLDNMDTNCHQSSLDREAAWIVHETTKCVILIENNRVEPFQEDISVPCTGK
jgi:hypothetical protein